MYFRDTSYSCASPYCRLNGLSTLLRIKRTRKIGSHMSFKPQNYAPIEFIRRRKKEIFDGGVPNGQVIASNIAFGAAVLGATHIELKNQDNWWFVASQFNWLKSNEHNSDINSLFSSLIPFPEQSPSSYRSEIYITAFSESAYVVTEHYSLPVFQRNILDTDLIKLPHIGVVPSWCPTVLAFRINNDGNGGNFNS